MQRSQQGEGRCACRAATRPCAHGPPLAHPTLGQVGDLLDRGDQELPLLYWLERLRRSAAAAGGAVHVLNGNHETMNVAGQYRYATRGGVARWVTARLGGVGLRRQPRPWRLLGCRQDGGQR
jgi:hypothetical protein